MQRFGFESQGKADKSAARYTGNGEFVIGEAEKHLLSAAAFKRMGRYQLEAAISMQVAPGIGSLVGRAVALAQAGEPAAGLAALEEIPGSRIVNYQPYWAARGHLLQLLNKKGDSLFSTAMRLPDLVIATGSPSASRKMEAQIADSNGFHCDVNHLRIRPCEFDALILNGWIGGAEVRSRPSLRVTLLDLVDRRRHFFSLFGVCALSLCCLQIGLGAG